MNLDVKQMGMEEAIEIAAWTYKGAYAIYTMGDDSVAELLSGEYVAVINKEKQLIGYYCFGESAQVPVGRQVGAYGDKTFIDIGLGMKPDLCGKGLGVDFVHNGLQYARNHLGATAFRLTVATFNQRAINVYERIGFKKVCSFERISEWGITTFDVMILAHN